MALARVYERCTVAAPQAMPFRAAGDAIPRRTPADTPSVVAGLSRYCAHTCGRAVRSTAAHATTLVSPSIAGGDGRTLPQGLCYNCDEQYVRGHKCPRLFYLEVADPEEEPLNLMDTPLLAAAAAESLITLNAINGIRGDDTMQVCVTVGTLEFKALLDSGSTTNFISSLAGRAACLHFQDGNGA
jgi:hypothetical protein